MKQLVSISLTTLMLIASLAANARGTAGVSNSGMNSNTSNSVMDSKGTASGFNSGWDSQKSYWRDNYPSSSYYSSSRNYTMYEPAYRYGYDLYNRNTGKMYNELNQEELQRGWDQVRNNSSLSWSDAELATRDAYNRMYNNRNAANSISR